MFFIFLSLISSSISEDEECELISLESDSSLYYEEKYFRFLANNYDNISPGDSWTILPVEKGIGFKAQKDFGSAIILKDWSMYSFKLTKIVFRPFCTVEFENSTDYCNAEMWLYHTKDNGYYPPGRRIFLKENYFVLIIPFKKSHINNPSNDLIFKFLRLDIFSQFIADGKGMKEISPIKPVKLYQIIQNQPAYLFEGKIPESGEETLYMVFSQYHLISESDFVFLEMTYKKIFGDDYVSSLKIDITVDDEYFRNWKNLEEMKPKVNLMMYNGSNYIGFKSLLTLAFFLTVILL